MPIPLNQVTVAEINMVGTMAAGGSNAQTVIFSFHLQRAAVAVNPTKAALDAAFQAAIAVPIAAALNVRYTQVYNAVRWVNDAQDGPQAFAHAAVGAIAGDSMASFDAAFILMRTALRGKSYRGGKHLSPMSETDTTGGTDDTWNAACLARLATIATAIVTPIVDATPNTWVCGVLSRVAPAQYTVNPTTVVWNQCVTAAVRKTIGSQKSRKAASVY